MATTIDDTEGFTIALSTPAKGQIVNLSYPATARRGALITVNAAVKNIGGESGHFYLQLYLGTTEKYEYEVGILAPGATSSSKPLTTTTPTSGASVTYTMKCLRVV